MTELEKFLTSLYDAVLQAEVAAQSHGQTAYTLLQASPSQRDSRVPVYHATNISIDLDVGLEAREENGVTRMYVTDRPEDDTAISFDLEVYDFIEPGDQPDLGDLPVEGGEGGEGGFPFARPDIGFVWDPPWDVNEEVLRTRLLEQAGEDVGEAIDESTDEESGDGGQGDESEGERKTGETRDEDGGGDGGGDDGSGRGDSGNGDDGGEGGSTDSESDGSGGSGEGGGGSDGGGDDGNEGGDDGGDGGPLGGLSDVETPVIDPRDRIREFVSDDDEVSDDG